MKEKIRTFICIEIEENLRKKFADLIEYFKKEDFDIKWVEEKNFHITLKFLGEIELSKISEISFILKNFKFNKFEIEFSGCGIFPNFSHPRVLWVGVKNGKEDLIKISGEINQELSKLKFEKEKNFHPHLTIGRIKSNRNKDKLLELIKEKNGENFGKMYVEEIVLMKSTLTQKGPIYEEIEKFKLEKE